MKSIRVKELLELFASAMISRKNIFFRNEVADIVPLSEQTKWVKKYECNIVRLDSSPGIRTAEDLIAFSQLINKTYKGNKTLDDFGKQVNGEMIYSLCNDIELTEEDCNRLEPIGYHTDIPFSDTFDGKG